MLKTFFQDIQRLIIDLLPPIRLTTDHSLLSICPFIILFEKSLSIRQNPEIIQQLQSLLKSHYLSDDYTTDFYRDEKPDPDIKFLSVSNFLFLTH